MDKIRNIDSHLSILLVEDSEVKRLVVNKYIEGICPKLSITIAKDRISALKILEVEKFDIMLLDMHLPNREEDNDPQEDGGEMLLEEIFFEDNFKQPTKIIALTQYDKLQKSVREKFPELGAIKFDPSSSKWKEEIFRVLYSLSKSKIEKKIIVYCEGKNAVFYNAIGISNLEFWELSDSRAIYFAAKNESDKLALRDRDFLTTNEISVLTSKPFFENYRILEYYCFENYLYHPDNIIELVEEFDYDGYISDLILQKNIKIEAIIQDYKISRLAYTDFNENAKRNIDKNPEIEIIPSLKSDILEEFYKFFDMAGKNDKENKKSYDKTFLSKYNLDTNQLVKTKWFRMKITEILKIN